MDDTQASAGCLCRSPVRFQSGNPPRFRGEPWEGSPTTDSSETAPFQDFPGTLGISRPACHAEGRGFESLQPLQKRPAFAGLFRVRSRLVRLRRAGLKPDPRPLDQTSRSKKVTVLQVVLERSKLLTCCGGDARGREIVPRRRANDGEAPGACHAQDQGCPNPYRAPAEHELPDRLPRSWPSSTSPTTPA